MRGVSGVYQIRNLQNGHVYFGSAICFRSRWNRHLSHLRAGTHHCRHLQAAWNKYGETAFVFYVVMLCPPSECVRLEQEWLDNTDKKLLYNTELRAGSALGVKRSAKTRARLSAAKLGVKRSPEACARIAAGCKGTKKRPLTPESLLKRARAIKASWDNLPEAVREARIAHLHSVRGIRGQKHARN